MEKYNKIWVPDPAGVNWVCDSMREAFIDSKNSTIHGPVIVLTVEELEKVWNAGWRAKVLENHPTAINKDFKTYLQSKGINIEC